jgi:hypothetical protein
MAEWVMMKEPLAIRVQLTLMEDLVNQWVEAELMMHLKSLPLRHNDNIHQQRS